MNFGLLLIAIFVTWCRAEKEYAFHGPPPMKEEFAYGKEGDPSHFKLHYYTEPVTWTEANAICNANGMILAHLNEPGIAKFAAESLTQTFVNFDFMWIGARRSDEKRSAWRWEADNRVIPDASVESDKFGYMYPPWVNNQSPMRPGMYCLGLDRAGHSIPIFVDGKCHHHRPFICQTSNLTEPQEAAKISVLGQEYIFYHARLTWDQAVAFCKEKGYTLATITNDTFMQDISLAMLRARPAFEDAWIGLRYNEEETKWNWVETGGEVAQSDAKPKDPSQPVSDDNLLEPAFPPWDMSEVNWKGHECVLLDRHMCFHPRFIPTQCQLSRDVICTRTIKEVNEVPPEPNPVNLFEGWIYTLVFIPFTWEEGMDYCMKMGNNSKLLRLTNNRQAKFITSLMADQRLEVSHVWLSGKHAGEHWVWVNKTEELDHVEVLEEIPAMTTEDGFPYWCYWGQKGENEDCLNLDRHDHNTPVIYGLGCNTTQFIICMEPKKIVDVAVEYDGNEKDKQDPKTKVRATLVPKLMSPDTARRVCEKEVGSLWRPRHDLPGSAAAINAFIDKLKNLINGSDEFNYHVAGKFEPKDNKWTLGSGHTFDLPTTPAGKEGDCLVLNVRKDGATWKAVPCHDKVLSQILCRPSCDMYTLPFDVNPEEWSCRQNPSEIFDHKMLGMQCHHECAEKANVGPETFYCGKHGWFAREGQVQVHHSKCIENSKALDMFNNPPKVKHLVFITDPTYHDVAYVHMAKYLISVLTDYYSSRSNVSVSTILLNDAKGQVSVALRRQPVNGCPDVNTVATSVTATPITVKPHINYGEAFNKVKELYGNNPKSLHIVVIAHESNQKGLLREIASSMNNMARVFAIGTNGRVSVTHLNEMATQTPKDTFSVLFHNAQKFGEALSSTPIVGEVKCPEHAAIKDEYTKALAEMPQSDKAVTAAA